MTNTNICHSGLAMTYAAQDRFSQELESIRDSGLYKDERIITSPQSAEITLADGRKVLNFCANNYLGLADHPRLIEAAKKALDTHGFGMASVRFICGTQDLHKQLEHDIAKRSEERRVGKECRCWWVPVLE